MTRRFWMGATVLFPMMLGGCDRNQVTSVECEGGPQIPAIVAEVRDQHGTPTAIGAWLTATGEGVDILGFGFGDSLELPAYAPAPFRGGQLSVEVEKPWHDVARVEQVNVPGGACGIESSARIEVLLNLRSDAPPVRQVVLPAARYHLGRGLSVHVPAFVETDEGISQALHWESSDSSVVSVTQSGGITAQCVDPQASAWVTARSVVDPTARDSVPVTVGEGPPSGPCS